MRLRVLLLGSALLPLTTCGGFTQWSIDDPGRVRITVEGPQYQFEPGHFRLRISVEPDPANRDLTVTAISEMFARSSYEHLDGVHSPRTRWLEYHNIPAGQYVVIATVDRGTEPSWEDRAFTSVLTVF